MYNPLLKTFVSVADCGSFSKAATELFISVPAVQKQINALENHLGLKLLVRNNRGVTLTQAGASIYKDAQNFFALSKRAIDAALSLTEDAKYTIHVGTSMLYPGTFFMHLWQSVEQALPGYTVQIVPFADHHAEILNELRKVGAKYDCIVGPCNSDFWKTLCNYLVVGETPVCVAVPKGHRLANQKLLNLPDLFQETVLIAVQGDSPIIDQVRATLASFPQITIEDVPNFYDAATFNRAEREKKILLTLECWSNVHPSLVTLAVNWEYRIPYGILYAFEPSRQMEHFLDVLKGSLAAS